MDNNIDINVIVNGEEQLRNLSTSLRRMIVAVNDSSLSVKVLDQRQRALNIAVGNTGRGLNNHAKTLQQVAGNQSLLNSEIKRTIQDLNRLKKVAASGGMYGSMQAGIRSSTAALEQNASALKRIKARAFISDLRGVGQEMKRLGKDAQFVGRSLIIGLTTPIIAFGRIGLQNFYAINKELTRLQKLLARPLVTEIDKDGNVKKGLEEITASAEKLSYEYGIAKELLLGISGDFAELGINIDSSINALTEIVAQFATLGDMDVSAAKDVTQTLYLGSLAAMEMSGEMARLSDVYLIQESAIKKVKGQMVIFNALENATALSMREIAQTLPEISAAGLAFGLNFTEMTAILAPMKAIGIDVASAATGIKVSFQKLVNPTIKMQKELKRLSDEQKKLGNKELAQDFLDVQGMGIESIQSLIDVTIALKASTAGSEGVLAFYSQLFDDRQSTRMLVAMKDLASFQEGMFASSAGKAVTAQERFVAQINKSLAGTGLFVKDIQTLSEVTTLANTKLEDGATEKYVESLERTVTKAEIDAAIKARQDLTQFIKDEQKDGRNAIEDITSEAGKALAINFAGASSALDIANEELQRAKDSTAMAIDRIRIAFKNLSASFIQDLAPTIEKLSQKFMDFVKSVQALPPETKQLIVKLLAAAAALGPLVFVMGQARLAGGVMLESFMRLMPGIRNLSVASVESARGLQFLKHGLTMQGDTIVNTNSRFATFIATLSSGNGPISKLARTFGQFTGILSKTSTASADVKTALSELTSAGSKASMLATPDPFKTGLKGRLQAQTEKEMAKLGFAGAASQKIPLISGADASKQAQEALKAGRARAISQSQMMSDMEAGMNRRLAASRTKTRVTATDIAGMTEKGGKVFDAKGRQVKEAALAKAYLAERTRQEQHHGKLLSNERRKIASMAQLDRKAKLDEIVRENEHRTKRNSAIASANQRAKANAIKSVREEVLATETIRGRVKTKITAVKGVATGAVVRAKDFAIAPVTRFTKSVNSASTAVSTLTARHRMLQMSAPGVFAKARVAVMAFTRSIFMGNTALKIMKLTLVSTGIGAILLAIAAIVLIVMKNFDTLKKVAEPGIKSLQNALTTLMNIGKALLAPFLDFFATFAGADKGKGKAEDIGKAFNKIATFIEKAAKMVELFVNKYVVPLLRNALGAVMNMIRGIIQFIRGIIKLKDNWREGLSMMWDGMKKFGGAIVKFFLSTVVRLLAMGAFQVARLIVMAITGAAKLVVNIFRWMMKTSLAINTALAKGIVTAFAWLAKTVVNAIRWLVTGTVSLFGAMAKTNIEIIFGLADAGVAVVGFIINAFSLLPRGIGNGIEAAANIFADFIDGIANAVRGTPIIGWLADKAGLVDAARSGADAIRGVGKFIGEAGRDVADFVNGLMDPVSGLVEAGRGAALGLVDGAIGAINGLVNGAADGVNNVIDGIGDGLNNVIDDVSGNLSDMIDGTADGINNFFNALPDAVESAGDWVAGVLEGFNQSGALGGEGAGADFLDGLGKKVTKPAVIDEVEDPMVDAGGDAGESAGSAAGEGFAEKLAEKVKELKQKFVDAMMDYFETTIGTVQDKLTEALEKQKEAALKVYDTQLKAIDALEKAEESLTREKEYQANRRKLIDERELQRANYQRNRALAIYEGRIDDARVLSLEDQANQKDFQENLTKTDEDRRKELAKENLDYLKDSIKTAQEETEKMLDKQIKAFEEAAQKITKFPPITIQEYNKQLNELNDIAKKIAGENGDILEKMMTDMKNKLKMPNENVGVFTTGLDQLVQVAQQKYGLTATTADNTIVGATIGMLAGINNQMVGNRGTITAAFNGIVSDVFNVASGFKKISTEVVQPTLKEIENIFVKNNPFKVFEEAMKEANLVILREMQKTYGHVASVVDGMGDLIDKALIDLAAAQIKIEMGTSGGGAGAGAGSSSGGSTSGNGGDNNRGDQTLTPDGSAPGSTYQMRIEQVRKGIRTAVESATKPYSNRSYYSEVVTMVTNGLLDIYTFDKYTLATFKSFFSGADEKSTLVRNILSLKPWGGIVTDLNRRYQMVGGYTNTGSGSSSGVGGVSGGNIRYNGGLIRRAIGGIVPGFSSQSVPALLHGGEYIVNANAVKNIGYSALEAMNNMKYASPNKVSAPSSTTVNETQNINIYVDTFVGEDQWFESMMKQYNLKVVPRNQKAAGVQSRTVSSYNGLNRGM